MALFFRTKDPPVFDNSRQYRELLRIDFMRRCAYCERPEDYMGGTEGFEIDHFRPRSKFPQLDCSYENLYYSCSGCNSHKSVTWPSAGQLAKGLRFADPCQEDPYTDHLKESLDGTVEGITPCGAYTRDHLRLHRGDVSTWRRQRAQARDDMPILMALVQESEILRNTMSDDSKREEVQSRIDALNRRIDESERRFAI